MAETRRAFHEELSQLTTDTVRLAVMARQAIHTGTRALLELDLEAVSAVIDDDREIDELTDSIEERAFDVLARQSPAAGDLRTLMTTIRGIHELELAIDVMEMSACVDHVVIFSGDGDFRRVLELVESKGVRVEVVAFAASTAMELRSVADQYTDIGGILREISV